MQALTQYILVAALLLSARSVLAAAAPVDDQARIVAAASQLLRTQLDSGFFSYDFNFATGEQTDMAAIDAPNLVRQAGAAFSLGEYLAWRNDEAVRLGLARALARLEQESVPISKGVMQRFLEATGLYNRWQLWEMLPGPLLSMGLLYQPEGEARLVSVYGSYEMARPGGTALALLAALRYREVTGDTRFDAIIQQWKDGLLVLRVSGRGVRASPDVLSESAYDNAETWFALAAYSREFPDDRSLDDLLPALDAYMLEQYGQSFNVRFFHWGTMAAAVRYEVTGEQRFARFMDTLAGFFVGAVGYGFPEENSCAAIEGLATYLWAVTPTDPEGERLRGAAREYVYRAMSVNRRLQIDTDTANEFAIAPVYDPQLRDYRGAFLKSLRDPLMQVDLTQHCLNALLRMERAGVAR